MNYSSFCLRKFATTMTATALVATAPFVAGSEPLKKIEFLGAASFPGDSIDESGDTGLLENGEPRNRLGGFSALDYMGNGNHYAALPDRGPDDGAVGYTCRVQILEIDIQLSPKTKVGANVKQTIVFSDQEGRRLTGSSAAIQATKELGHRFDPEGFRFGPAGTMFVSDEYGPVLLQFSPEGRELRRYDLPAHLLVTSPHADKKSENQANRVGRASNRGMECLALSGDGQHLIGLMQGPLLQDGRRTEKGGIEGRNCRLIKVDSSNGKTSEFVYQIDSKDNGNSEIVSFGPDQYLVLERDGEGGHDAGYRKLIHIDLRGATDVSEITSLPADHLSEKITPVKRTVFLDLLDPEWGLAGDSMPEKIEGLTFGPTLSDGRRSLLVATDNDFEAKQPTLIWVFAVKSSP